MESISICISTFGDRIESLSRWNFDGRIKYLILWQKGGSLESHPNFPSNVRLMIFETVGVTLTRNIALEQCNTKWLWFMDDDVSIPQESIESLLNLLPKHRETEILIASVEFGHGTTSKKFVGNSTSIYRIFGVGTIQIICCPAVARQYGCLFPTNMGAGTQYPVCDEPVFLSRMIKKGHVKLDWIPEVIIMHPPLSSGMNFHSAGHLISRAILFREIFGFPLCFLGSFLFFVRHFARVKWNFRFLFYYYRAL